MCLFGIGSRHSKHHRRHRVLAIVFVIRPRHVLTVGHRALIHEVAKKLRRPNDRWIDLRIRDAAAFARDDRHVPDQPGRIYRAVGRDGAVQFSIRRAQRNAVPEGAIHALPLRKMGRVGLDRGQ